MPLVVCRLRVARAPPCRWPLGLSQPRARAAPEHRLGLRRELRGKGRVHVEEAPLPRLAEASLVRIGGRRRGWDAARQLVEVERVVEIEEGLQRRATHLLVGRHGGLPNITKV